ncbi:heavy metal-associated domain-containing protein [Treponema sp. HNW]|uniref:heavy-metal-associated domain-containing protein n=1 Tax=Treponema sp. HNW TaxID=3116654 RepID=UPI003D1089C2
MINIIILIIVAAAVVLAVMRIRKGAGGCCGCSSCSGGCSSAGKGNSDKDTLYPASSSLVLDITGMHCEKCSGSVTEALNALDGVSAEVDLKNNSASVKLSKEISAEKLEAAVSDRGFEVTRIRVL